MTALITKEFRMHNALQFKEQFSESTPDSVYMFIGKATAWPSDASPPTPVDSDFQTYYEPWENMIAMKRITTSDVSFSSNRFNWTSGTVYTQYSSDLDINSSQYYVITDEFKVYKCISNNAGAQSTIKPTSTSTSTFKLGDGYTWKYMLTLDAAGAVKFLSSDHFPVKTLTVDDSSLQWDVQDTAIDGGIHSIRITSGGSAYLSSTGSVVSATSTTAVLSGSASGTNSVYNDYAIYIISGTGAGQIRTISAYNGTTKAVTVSSAWTTTPDATSVYIVSPRIVLNGNGSGFIGYTTVTSGAITAIEVTNPGSGYTKVTGSIAGNTGSGATISPQYSPIGGHGSNATAELNGHNVTMNVRFSGTESGNFLVENDFRVVGLIVNPRLVAGDVVATGTVYDMTYKITVSSISGIFTKDEVITGGTSGATATILDIDGTTISVNNVSGTFTGGETITGGTSSATCLFTSIANPLVAKYTGNIIYLKNQLPIFRTADQTEDYRVVVKF